MQSKHQRRIIKAGLLMALLLTVVLVFKDTQDYAALRYPPIPDEYYEYIIHGVKDCELEESPEVYGIMAGLIWRESTFHSNAVSGAGAKGPSQVLSGTALGVANEYQIAGLNAQTIFDPRLNINIGTCYIHSIFKRLSADPNKINWADRKIWQATLIAYNAGPARGKSFLSGNYNGPISSIGYANRILEAADTVYIDDFKRYLNAQPTTPTDSIAKNLRGLITNVFLKSSTNDD